MPGMNNKFKEEKKISYQVLRIEKFNQSNLDGIGRETERTAKRHRNEDIDDERTPLNHYFKKSDDGLRKQWKSILENTHVTFQNKKDAVAFEGMIITSDTAFFERLGYIPDEKPPYEVLEFFDRAYKFALSEIGYRGTDENILSAVVHFDETTPHLQLYYVPLVDTAKKKVYAKDSDGKILRNEKGSPVQKKDEYGKSVYEYVKLDAPKVCSSDFWAERGGQLSYGNLQDDFYEQVSCRYGLERGEVGSNRKHTTKYQWQKQRQEAALAEIEERATRREEQARFASAMKDRALTELKEIESRKQSAAEELKPLESYVSAFRDAMEEKLPLSPGKLRKMVVGLTTEYKRLEKDKAIGDKDKEQLFGELQKAQRRIPELEKYKEFIEFLNTYAPDKLNEAKRTANERQTEKLKPKSSSRGNIFTK